MSLLRRSGRRHASNPLPFAGGPSSPGHPALALALALRPKLPTQGHPRPGVVNLPLPEPLTDRSCPPRVIHDQGWSELAGPASIDQVQQLVDHLVDPFEIGPPHLDDLPATHS